MSKKTIAALPFGVFRSFTKTGFAGRMTVSDASDIVESDGKCKRGHEGSSRVLKYGRK